MDKRDKRLLWELDQDCRQPTTRLAKKLRIPVSVANYRIERLVRKGFITRFVAMVNYAGFGLSTYKVYLQFQGMTAEAEKEVLAALTRDRRIGYVARYSGQWDLVFAVYTNQSGAFDRILSDFMDRYSGFILRKALSILVEVEVYNRDYFLERQGTQKKVFGSTEVGNIDEKDKSILKFLQENARASVVDMALKLKLTARQVAYRMRQMRKEGIIIAYRVDLDHAKMGLEFYKAFITTHRYSKEKDRSFRTYCMQQPHCLHLVKSIGDWDYELEFEVEGHSQFNAMLKEMRQRFGEFIRTIDTVLIEKELKFEFL
jgi:Lrp/AsnC family leucine-responsive transcriptional regulator